MDFRRYVTIIVIMWAYYGLLTAAQSIHGLAPLAYQILLGISINSLPKQRARKGSPYCLLSPFKYLGEENKFENSYMGLDLHTI